MRGIIILTVTIPITIKMTTIIEMKIRQNTPFTTGHIQNIGHIIPIIEYQILM
jgi:hypothetical protein